MTRQGFIGGSDLYRLYKGEWLELWEEKTGRREPEDLSRSLPVQMGAFTEPLNVKWFEQEMHMTVGDRNKREQAVYEVVPLSCEVDGLVLDEGLPVAVLETKHTGSWNDMAGIIKAYAPQMHLYMYVHGLELAYISVFFGNAKWEATAIRWNDEFFEQMMQMVTMFWGYVERDESPENRQEIIIDDADFELDDMVVRDATGDNEWTNYAQEYIENEGAARSFENAKKTLKQMVAANEREIRHPILSARRDKRGAIRFYKEKSE